MRLFQTHVVRLVDLCHHIRCPWAPVLVWVPVKPEGVTIRIVGGRDEGTHHFLASFKYALLIALGLAVLETPSKAYKSAAAHSETSSNSAQPSRSHFVPPLIPIYAKGCGLYGGL